MRGCLKKNQSTPRPSEHPPVMGGEMSKRFACFAAAIFLFFCVVYWLWFSLWKREGVALNLKALLVSRLLSALLIDTLNLLG